jgi:hypothetical protein
MFRIQRRTVAETFNEGPVGALAGAGFFRAAGAAVKAKRTRTVENRYSTISV